MAKIVYKDGKEGQNKLSCIEGLAIDATGLNIY